MKQKWIAIFLGVTLTLGLAAGAEAVAEGEAVTAAEAPAEGEAVTAAEAPAEGEAVADAEAVAEGEAVADAEAVAEGEAVAGAVTCPLNMTPSEKNNYPYMGISVELPETLLNAILDNKVFMRPCEDVEYTDLNGSDMVPVGWRPDPAKTILHSGGVEFFYVPKDIQNRTPRMGMEDPMLYDEYELWLEDTVPMARIGMYLKSEFQESMLEDDGYTAHDKLGENAQFVYYLCSNTAGGQASQEEKDLFATLEELKNGISVFEAKPMDDMYFGITTPEVNQISQVGSFQTETLDGEAIDQTCFSGKKLTMVNAWTTWCGACIEEMPDLEELSRELANSDVQIITIACDTADAKGEIDEELLELAQQIAKRTGTTFQSLIPDASLKNGLLQGILGYPTTWFVDEDGNIVGDAVLGSNSKNDWMALIQERLEEVNA